MAPPQLELTPEEAREMKRMNRENVRDDMLAIIHSMEKIAGSLAKEERLKEEERARMYSLHATVRANLSLWYSAAGLAMDHSELAGLLQSLNILGESGELSYRNIAAAAESQESATHMRELIIRSFFRRLGISEIA